MPADSNLQVIHTQYTYIASMAKAVLRMTFLLIALAFVSLHCFYFEL